MGSIPDAELGEDLGDVVLDLPSATTAPWRSPDCCSPSPCIRRIFSLTLRLHRLGCGPPGEAGPGRAIARSTRSVIDGALACRRLRGPDRPGELRQRHVLQQVAARHPRATRRRTSSSSSNVVSTSTAARRPLLASGSRAQRPSTWGIRRSRSTTSGEVRTMTGNAARPSSASFPTTSIPADLSSNPPDALPDERLVVDHHHPDHRAGTPPGGQPGLPGTRRCPSTARSPPRARRNAHPGRAARCRGRAVALPRPSSRASTGRSPARRRSPEIRRVRASACRMVFVTISCVARTKPPDPAPRRILTPAAHVDGHLQSGQIPCVTRRSACSRSGSRSAARPQPWTARRRAGPGRTPVGPLEVGTDGRPLHR